MAAEADKNPAEAMAVARMYLQGSCGLAKNFEFAKKLLLEVFKSWRDPVAAVWLARDYSDENPAGPHFLVEDEIERGLYFEMAQSTPQVTNYLVNKTQEEFEETYESFDNFIEFYEAGKTPEEYFSDMIRDISGLVDIAPEMAAVKYYEAALDVLIKLEHRDSRRYLEKYGQFNYVQLQELARDWFKNAVPYVPQASTKFALRFTEKNTEERFRLFKLAAQPDSGSVGDVEAKYYLAAEYHLNKNSPQHDASLGEALLEEYIDACHLIKVDEHDYWFVGNEDAPGVYANIVYAKASGSKKQLKRAFDYFRASHRPHSAFSAALMALRGEGCKASLDLAKRLFQKARAPDAQTTSTEDRIAVAQARIALFLGWEKPDHISDVNYLFASLFAYKNEKRFGEFFLSFNDVVRLTENNVIWKHDGRAPTGLMRWSIRIGHLAQCMRYLFAQKRNLPPEYLKLIEESWEGDSGFKDLLLGHLYLTDAFGDADPDLAQSHFDVAADHAKEALRYPPENIVQERTFQLIAEAAKQGRADAERLSAALQQRETVYQTQRDMLSFLTHTLNNTFSSRAEAGRMALEALGSDMYETVRGRNVVVSIASMLSAIVFAEQLVSTFKVYISDPEALRQNWQMDRGGDWSVTAVLAMSLRQTLAQMMFAPNHQTSLKRLLPQGVADSIKNTRKSFMDEMTPLDVSTENAQSVYRWVSEHFEVLKITIDPDAELFFGAESTRFTFFFSVFSEIIFNALKYADTVRPIEIFWGFSGDNYVFRCSNSCSETSVQNRQGSGKGLVFLKRIVDTLGAKDRKATFFTHLESDKRFVAEIKFSKTLVRGAA